MADLGAIGRRGAESAGMVIGQTGPGYVRGTRVPADFYFGAMATGGVTPVFVQGKDASQGNPAPSQRQGRPGVLKTLVLVAGPGARSIKADCKLQATDTPLPQLIVKANPEVGLMADVVVTAASSLAWQTLTANFTATAAGVVQVWRSKRHLGEDNAVWWDNFPVRS